MRINDPAGDAASLAHLITFDSVHGRWHHEASSDGDEMVIGNRILCTRNKEIGQTDWSDCDVVIEASGKMKTNQGPAQLQDYLQRNGGDKRVVVTGLRSRAEDPRRPERRHGVNHHLYDKAQHPHSDGCLLYHQLPGARGEGGSTSSSASSTAP